VHPFNLAVRGKAIGKMGLETGIVEDCEDFLSCCMQLWQANQKGLCRLPRPDTHSQKPPVAVPVRRVGVTDIRVPIQGIFFEEQPAIVVPSFDIYVDLPAHQKGIHPSRSIEAAVEVVSKYAEKLYRLEDICADIAREQLRRHDYASESEVFGRADTVYARSTPKTNIRTYESCTMQARAIAHRGTGDEELTIRRWIGVTATGITACPCAQELLQDISEEKLTSKHKLEKRQAREIVEGLPIGSHMQRSHGSVMVEIPAGYPIDALQLVKIVEQAMSAVTFEILKRPDEAEVVQAALGNPCFVEDSIRHMIRNVVETFKDLPDEMELFFKQRNEECVHRHDLVAEQTLTMGEARREIKENTT
jgi:GTP cyclohydrolase-4